MPDTPSIHNGKPEHYVVIAVYVSGSDKCAILNSFIDGVHKIFLFDTVHDARDFLPLLGDGRVTNWGADGESACWFPLSPTGYNRAVILTGYDPYNAPSHIKGIRSEAKSMSWKHHVMWSAMFDMGQMKKHSDGTVENTLLTSRADH